MNNEIDITELPIVDVEEYWPVGSIEWQVQQVKKKFLAQDELPFPLPSDDVIKQALQILNKTHD